ncbi:MAG: ABC transporter permease [Acidimicrobiaceae bacterium]|nr:ABC transporter permease [Acidimicrobiaceae bacterium]MDE0515571.1 ABC transporter permease [Acidimicrobiaceae bacterium]MDE0655986.1 ABC transporter permease [Acidimicrobiaceae bacterium]MXZ96869.1 ABC transporter permease [Acidimicrobiaceae bacterium]MYF42979.1 ABC transporter permease [Acidimicrobiaceae bacterium]
MIGRTSRNLATRASRASLLVATPPALAMLVFFVVPIAVVVVYSFLTGELFQIGRPATAVNYESALTLGVNRTMVWNSIVTGTITASVTVAVGLPVAYWLQFSAGRMATSVVSLVVASMFAGYLVRIYAWRTVLGSNGVVNASLERVGLIDEPVGFLIFSRTAVIIAELHLLLPFAIIILYAAIRPVRSELLEAAEDLGAGPAVRWRQVILPLMASPIASAWTFVFIISSADFVTPQFLGGLRGQLIGTQINRYFREAGDYGKGAALAILMILFYAALYALIRLGLRLARLNRVDWG